MQAPDIFNFLKVRGGSWFNPLGSGSTGLPQPHQHRAFALQRLHCPPAAAFLRGSSQTPQNRAEARIPKHWGARDRDAAAAAHGHSLSQAAGTAEAVRQWGRPGLGGKGG